MADFSPAFAENGERRFPNATEADLGFQCGAGQRQLFNGMFHRIEAELGSVIGAAGLTPSDADLTQVLQAIQALIAAATGAGDTSTFVLMTQARARLPIFPDVLNADGRIGITAPATGTVRIAGGVTFQHRGIFQVTTTQTDFLTDPSKIYHMRWDPTNGVRLLDLANATYNPTALVETNPAFDSKYDDMLIGRVITNSSNVATITSLTNKSRLRYRIDREQVVPVAQDNYSWTAGYTFNLNWARTPELVAVNADIYCTQPDPQGVHGGRINSAQAVSRYAVAHTVWVDWNGPGTSFSSVATGAIGD